MGVSKTTVQRWIVASTICVHSNSLKPILTEENKLARLLMANHFHDPQDPFKYQDMRDCIHLDETWFFLTHEKEHYLLVLDEKNPKHCVKHKSHITKVMFLCNVKVTEKALSTMNMMKATRQKTPKIKEYPSYLHTSGRMGGLSVPW